MINFETDEGYQTTIRYGNHVVGIGEETCRWCGMDPLIPGCRKNVESVDCKICFVAMRDDVAQALLDEECLVNGYRATITKYTTTTDGTTHVRAELLELPEHVLED